ncbi:MAG TPA: ferritin-like fold-containing protein [Alphaproteobacteria bacterium]|nr:ferritin-like fold-containing protein [Alphaproteobacteria bacterium]
MDAAREREDTLTYREYAPESVEVDSPMTAEYRATLLRLMANQAYGERHASNTYAPWINKAPGVEERRIIAEIVTEEFSHWRTVVELMGDLGVPWNEVQSYQSFHHFYPICRCFVPVMRWTDILMSTFLIDRAAYYMLEDYAQSSYAPWARAVQDSLAEEERHGDLGMDFLRTQMDKIGPEPLQRALNKWWRFALNMYGPNKSRHHDTYIRLGLKFRSNEDRRQAFISDGIQRIEEVGLAVPRLIHNSYPYF